MFVGSGVGVGVVEEETDVEVEVELVRELLLSIPTMKYVFESFKQSRTYWAVIVG